MENPEQDIRRVLDGLFRGSVAEQTATVAKYFLPDASFASPCCRVPSFSSLPFPGAAAVNSGWAMLMIYRLYRILSPRVEFKVDSCVFDSSANILYVNLQLVLTTWFLPVRRSPVRLVSTLNLKPLDKKTFAPDSSNAVRDATDCGECSTLITGPEEDGVLYFIAGQRDYWQVDDAAGLLGFWPGALVCRALQGLGSMICVVVAIVCMPVYCRFWPNWVSRWGVRWKARFE